MEFLSTLPIDTTSFNDLEKSLVHDYGLVIRPISEMNHSFERALSICLFGNEEEVQSISDTLNGQCDGSCKKHLGEDDCYIRSAAQTYGITIHIHHNNSIKLYEIECDCPIVHLVKLVLKDESSIYLATAKADDEHDVDDTNKSDCQSLDDYTHKASIHSSHRRISFSQFKSICTLDVSVRQIVSDGNCFFRALSDQLSGSQDGHLVLRELIVDYLNDHRGRFETSIDNQHFTDWKDFVRKMRRNGTLVDGIVVIAAALSLRRSIIIHQHAQRPVLFKSVPCITFHPQIHLAYDFQTLHYNSLYSINNTKLYVDDSECILA